jgi:hypothetical protein
MGSIDLYVLQLHNIVVRRLTRGRLVFQHIITIVAGVLDISNAAVLPVDKVRKLVM